MRTLRSLALSFVVIFATLVALAVLWAGGIQGATSFSRYDESGLLGYYRTSTDIDSRTGVVTHAQGWHPVPLLLTILLSVLTCAVAAVILRWCQRTRPVNDVAGRVAVPPKTATAQPSP